MTITPDCPYEDPPTNFTGGLVLIAHVQPRSGEFTIDYEGNRIDQLVGTVDWGSGTLSTRSTYIEGYFQAYEESESSFLLEPNGDWVSTGTETRVQEDGTEILTDFAINKTGCTTITETWMPDIEEPSVRTATLVSEDRIEWTYETENSGGSGWSFYSRGFDTSDWHTVYSFETDDPATEDITPERLGTCEVFGDGSMICEMVHYRAIDAWRQSSHVWEPSGDHTVEYESHEESLEPEVREWGTQFNSYEGDGWLEWSYLRRNSNEEIHCAGSWDTDGVGTWECDDETSGTYP
ncbi:MAG: hypothetical protein H6740_05490 [Alphaproteobacteria bacterium]|nr:hypothetical protein [Alphaproteobacteria bacterium]